MKKIETDCATIKIHGSEERERIEEATIKYIKGVLKCQQEKKKEKQKI